MGIYQWPNGRRASAIASCGLAAIALVAGCKDKAIEPKPAVDYPVYFASESGSSPKLFVFHPSTFTVDSIASTWGTTGLVTVSADGRRLYLNPGNKVIVVDANSLTLITELPYRSSLPVAVSPDNRLVAITGNDLTILRTTDYSVVLSDTNTTGYGRFSRDSKAFYCTVGWSGGGWAEVYRVDLSDSNHVVTRKAFPDGVVIHAVESLDETKWFLYLGVATDMSAFEVYDVGRDSIILRKYLSPGTGDLAETPDGRYVFFTNAGYGSTSSVTPQYGFTIFDVESNRVLKEVIDTLFFSSDTLYRLPSPPHYLAVSPDGRWLVLLSSLMSRQYIYLYDISNDQLVHRWMGYPRSYWNISTQPLYQTTSNWRSR
ncbi:MAG: hypothetical protein HY851_07080 [candidate division Zixibacteria bacterium]|nr:hypothetical protein [candidate division Zixibacteria bacterium]